MSKKPKDRHLDIPSEANRDKHINYVAREQGEADPSEDKRKGMLSADQEHKKEKDRPTKK